MASTQLTGEISTYHQEQIIEYLNFSRYQRNQHLREVEATFKETKESRLMEDTYTSADVDDMLEGLCAVVKQEVQKELLHTSHCNVLLLRQFFVQAERIFLDLKVDTTELENQGLLKQVASFEESAQKGDVKKLARLPTYSDKALQHAVGAINAEKEKFQERFQKLQAQCTSILKEKTAVGEELEKLKKEYKAFQDAAAAGGAKTVVPVEPGIPKEKFEALQKECSVLRDQLEEKSIKLKDVETQLTRKVNETLPFINMKKMLRRKNEQMKDLRKKLNKYEPEDDDVVQDEDD